jgi:hypothetical protein
MKTLKMMAAMLALTLCASVACADDAPPTTKPAMAKMVRGVIKAIGTGDTPDLTIQPMGRAAQPQVVGTMADTKVKGNGNKTAVKDLAVGQTVFVKLDAAGKNAVLIAVFVPGARGGPNARPGAAAQ